jgi:hypothetical protein
MQSTQSHHLNFRAFILLLPTTCFTVSTFRPQ